MIVLLFIFHMTHWSRILANRWLLSNHFCKTCQNYNFSKFWVFDKKISQKWKKIWCNWFQCMIALLVYFNLVHSSFIFGHGWLHSNPFGCCTIAFAGDFTTKATIGASALLCVQWQNLDEDCFDMLYKMTCWATIPDPIWMINVPYERKINITHSIKNVWSVILILRDSALNLGLFDSHCILRWFTCYPTFAPATIAPVMISPTKES